MGNLFCSQYAIHRRFDLKGSTFGRTTDKPESEIEPTTTLKDLDLNFIFRLQKSWFQEFCRWKFPAYCFFSHQFCVCSMLDTAYASICFIKARFIRCYMKFWTRFLNVMSVSDISIGHWHAYDIYINLTVLIHLQHNFKTN